MRQRSRWNFKEVIISWRNHIKHTLLIVWIFLCLEICLKRIFKLYTEIYISKWFSSLFPSHLLFSLSISSHPPSLFQSYFSPAGFPFFLLILPFFIYFSSYILTPIFLSPFTTLLSPSLPPSRQVPAPPSSFSSLLLSDFHPSLPPSLSFSLQWKREFWKRERIRGECWRGGVGPYKSSCLQPPRCQKNHAETEGRKRTLTNLNLHPRDPYRHPHSHPNTGKQTLGGRREMEEEKKRLDLWPLIRNLFYFAFLSYK